MSRNFVYIQNSNRIYTKNRYGLHGASRTVTRRTGCANIRPVGSRSRNKRWTETATPTASVETAVPGSFPVLARRNPTLLLRLSGALLLRFATRQFCGLLFHDPPRMTRLEPLHLPLCRVFIQKSVSKPFQLRIER